MLETRNADWKAHELFEREAAVLRSLRHHGIPEVFEAVRASWNGSEASFLVMEHVEGLSLARMVAGERHVGPIDAVHLMLELLSILEYLHGRVPPILHRDIKPANIIVRTTGFPALVDFGSVRRVFMGPDESSSTIAGTYGYMPYEQYMGQASPSSDLYAVGATMLHLLTGRPPRDFMNAEGRIEVPADLPGDGRLRAVIARMLRPSPAERFSSAREATHALIATENTQLVSAAPRALARRVTKGTNLPPPPRTLDGVTKEQFDRVAYSMWDLMSASEKSAGGFGIGDIAGVALLSIITFGALPAVYANIARNRRRRLRAFFKNGTEATAEILEIALEKMPFDEQIARVNYQFEADGQIWRDADQVPPVVAHRWRVGDQLRVLYIPDWEYDSVIISTG
jgi:serine/threonine protein kinase